MLEAAKGRCSANYLFCSCQEAKIRHNIKFEEHLLGGFSGCFNGLFQSFSYASQFFQEAEFPYRTHQSITRMPMSISQIFLLLNRLKFVNYIKNLSCRILPNISRARHRENTNVQQYDLLVGCFHFEFEFLARVKAIYILFIFSCKKEFQRYK